ncbi:nuclear transport factor 2 family protein [Kaarinaea lacus]
MNTIIDNFKSVYGNLDASNISLVDTIYDDNVTFVDPFHEIRGLPTLMEYFSKLYENLESCDFEFGEVYSKPSSALIVWNMTFRHRSLSSKTIEVPGSTQIRFDDKIYFHRDYFDAGKMIYENIPVVGSVIKYIKGQV